MFMTDKQANKKYAKSYKQGLTTKPDPSVLETDYHQYDDKNGRLNMKAWDEMMARNHAVIRGWNDTARKKRLWVGRTLSDGVGDGLATYVVIKENLNTVRIKVCKGLGDDWVSRYWGEECSIRKIEAMDFMEHETKTKKDIPWDIVKK